MLSLKGDDNLNVHNDTRLVLTRIKKKELITY